jgi:putative IMPACT (imprinted ancient) family translation regulator
MSDTLSGPASLSVVVRQSRFTANASPAATVEDALAFVEGICDPAATHTCWAYRVGAQYRSNDDGEPAGTAGRPILAAIDGQQLDQVVVAVTRWFGGIKLGAGGLVRAYGGTAAECLRTAPRRPLVQWRELILRAGFDDIGAVHLAMQAQGAISLQESFDSEGLQLRLSVPHERAEDLLRRLRDTTRDRVRIEAGDVHA